MDDLSDNTLFEGLQALAESAFPKKCSTCGRSFKNAGDFIRETELIRPSVSGLKQSMDDDGSMIVELFRNCTCGSTLMDAFNNRRDMSAKGERRRKRFAELVNYLQEHHNIDMKTARDEILKVMRGEKSKLLAGISPPTK
ncbi:MAG: hypothetical protein ACI9D5_001806 [Candidatus Endobugula sp.]|jgi:hypothetical protein